MGRRDKEHKNRIIAGLEDSISSLQRTAVKIASRGKVLKELKNATTEEQIEVLDRTVMSSSRSSSKIRKAIERKSPGEMDKAIWKFRREGKEITVDSLCHEVKTTPGFLAMATRAGLSLRWFEDLARERMKKHGVL